MSGELLAPEHVTPLPGSAVAAVAWRSKGQLYVTVIAKATFAFAPDAPMPRTEPQEILRAEVHHGNDPGRSIQLTSDLAPYLGRADVLFTGSAFAPPGGHVRSLPVRLAIFAEQRPLLDKRLLVQDPSGFERMHLVYERALRGADEKENPLGMAASSGEPCITDPAKPGRAAGFGPIGRAWPARKRLLGSTSRAALDSPIAEIPDGFDWSYFQAAPIDQQIGYLRGDEWLILEGLHPSLPRFRTRLPGARGRARVHGLSAFGVLEGQPLELIADIFRIDGNSQRCTVVWRRSFPVASEAALGAVRIVAGVEVGGEIATLAVEPELVESTPYFVTKEPEPPPVPAAPEPPPPDVSLDRFAAISAEIHVARRQRTEILLAHQLTESAWAATERRWTEALKVDAKRGAGRLLRAHDSAYVAAVEGFRGPILPEEYASAVVAHERGDSDRVLDELRIPRPALMPVLRLWTRKVAADPKLFRAAHAALARLRSRGWEGPSGAL